MANLIAILYPDVATAKSARESLFALQKQYLIQIADAVVATHEESGKVKLDQSVPVVEASATSGALWGGILGLLVLNPLAGAAIGAATGGLLGKATDYGIEDRFMKDLAEGFPVGAAGLFVLTQGDLNDRVLPELARFGGRVIQSSLPSDGEAKLRAALETQTNAGLA